MVFTMSDSSNIFMEGSSSNSNQNNSQSFTRRLQASAWRLHSNTLQQVINSLEPLVTPSRHQTIINTYARRLHSRHLHRLNHLRRSYVNSNTDDPGYFRSMSSPLTTPLTQDNQNSSSINSSVNNDTNVVINIEDHLDSGLVYHNESTVEGFQQDAVSRPNVVSESDNAAASAGSNNESHDESSEQNPRIQAESISELLNQFPDVRNVLTQLWHYCIFFLIVLAKVFIDHFSGFVVIPLLSTGFFWSNVIVKKAIAHRSRGFSKQMFLLLINIPLGIFLLYYFYGIKVMYSLFLLPPESENLGVGGLLWVILITDYILKFMTVYLKLLICFLPYSFLYLQNRGKYFLAIEMGSQLYRSLAPVQPWLTYLLDDYIGPKKVLGVFFSATYMVFKGPDLLLKLKNLHVGIIKFIKSVNYGIAPSKSELDSTGGLCPICHDDFSIPTMLQCKHIFCEQCVLTWFDRERTCPMCRTQIADDPMWKDGSTSHFIQLY